jgi:tRNA pseudouridine13 synthase
VKLKARPNDFKVTELLREGFVEARGGHRVYRVRKRKLSSQEARAELADLAGVETGQVSLAGLKDRQGTTTQYMSIPRGKAVALSTPELEIESVGFAQEAIQSEFSRGNGFDIIARDLTPFEIDGLRENLEAVRRYGLLNYFDDQRFGNLRHQQGWIMLEFIRHGPEAALKRLLTAASPHDDERHARFKSSIYRHWGDWRSCRDVAGRFGAHHSVFEHLKREPEGFAKAFDHLSTSTRLIHLYAFQSHLWNRAVSRWVEESMPREQRFGIRGIEGVLGFPRGEIPAPEAWEGSFPLPGARLEGVRHEDQRKLYEGVLHHIGGSVQGLSVEGVRGFGLKPEERVLVLRPTELRIRPAEPDPLHKGSRMVRMTFELPRGAYASLVVRRLLGSSRPRPPGRGERPAADPRPAKR